MNERSASQFAPTVDAVAAFLGLKRRAVDGYIARGCPGRTDQGYDLSAIVQWCRDNVWKSGAEKPKRADIETERSRVALDRERLKLKQEAGELVSRKAAKAALEQAFGAVKSKLEGMADDIAAACPADVRSELQRNISQRVTLTLKELAEMSNVGEPS